MANQNTKLARQNGYSDIKRMRSGGAKNYGIKLGRKVDSSAERAASGKKPYNMGR